MSKEELSQDGFGQRDQDSIYSPDEVATLVVRTRQLHALTEEDGITPFEQEGHGSFGVYAFEKGDSLYECSFSSEFQCSLTHTQVGSQNGNLEGVKEFFMIKFQPLEKKYDMHYISALFKDGKTSIESSSNDQQTINKIDEMLRQVDSNLF